jgi:hypothetical protein
LTSPDSHEMLANKRDLLAALASASDRHVHVRSWLSRRANRVFQGMTARWRDATKAWRACRACGKRASLWDDICVHCGAGYPVRVSLNQALYLAAIAVAMILLAFCCI